MMIINNPKKYYKWSKRNRNVAENLFSIKNRDGIKYLTILGIEIKLKKVKRTSLGTRL